MKFALPGAQTSPRKEGEPLLSSPAPSAHKKVAIVGSPNVGKSVLFHRLTGTYVTVSNYPGTTVEVSRGKARLAGREAEVVDTPGIYSLLPITEEERVTRSILWGERPDLILHVVDAKNLERMLPLTLQLLETGFPVILVLNILDEAERLGMRFDLDRLGKKLGIPVAATVSVTGRGIDRLREFLEAKGRSTPPLPSYEEPLETLLQGLESALEGDYGLARRSLAALLLQEDREAWGLVEQREKDPRSLASLAEKAKGSFPHPPSYELALQRQRWASRAVHESTDRSSPPSRSWVESLSQAMISPWTGIPILLLILYYGIYRFVGDIGAGVLVDFLEGTIFEETLNPWLARAAASLLPWQEVQDLFTGEYGVLTLGLRYAVALILPLVTTFFLVFSLLEDSGYLPRLSILIDRLFKAIGLTGRAVIPMVLGLGCATMATMVTRTLPTLRERVIATLLLALAIPCSAQLGVILALFEGQPSAFGIWLGVIASVFLLVGFLSSRVLPGERPSFYMEIPPLRLPRLGNVLIKTYSRVHWYFKEIFPLFILASLFIWAGRITGVFDLLLRAIEYPVRLLGLPEQAAVGFLFGFFRRDYGAAGFYDLKKTGLLDGSQVLVAAVALTLFVPCVAQFLTTVKERGAWIGVGLTLFVLLFSFGTGFVLYRALHLLGVSL